MKRLKEIPKSWFVKIEAGAVCGIPDLIGCINGVFVAIELKSSPKKKPSKIQQYNLDLLHFAGAHTFVVNPENAEWVLKQLKKIKPRLLKIN